MRLRRLTLPAAAFFAVSSTAIAATGLPTQRQHAKRVEAQIAAVSVRLEPIVNAWEGARLRLATVDTRLHENVARLRLARANLRGAQIRIEHRLAELYVSPNPTVVDVLAGATSISDLIDRLKVSQVLSSQDAAIGRQAVVYQRAVTRREALLERQRHARAATVARLAASRQTIERNLATQRNLLASIHQNIRTLQAQQAARERRFAVQARVRIARRVALARERAAADALAPTPTAALPAPPAAPQPLPAAPAIAAAPAAPVPLPAAPAPTPAAPAVLPVAPPTHTIAASIAARYLGVPYAWGGASPAGFDCSGLVTYVYAQLGVSLPHYTVAQWNATLPIAASALQPGDLVFFDGLAHVGIYIGGGQFIHAPHTGTVVQIATLSGYWGQHLDGARRVP
jgi:cell wall-associated NlpC family hydrolase